MFVDRYDAGAQLAKRLLPLASEDPIVMALPRGGVPVGFEVARELSAPFDVVVVRKLGVPYQPELAMGAIGEGGVAVVDEDVMAAAHVTARHVQTVGAREADELKRRLSLFEGHRLPIDIENRTVIIVDDGIATGSTMRAACQVIRARRARRIVVAVPVASERAIEHLKDVTDDIVCLSTPEGFSAVGAYYADFGQTSDAEVVELLDKSVSRTAHAARVAQAPDPYVRDEQIDIEIGHNQHIAGHFVVPEKAIGCVVFAHGSGSSRHSPRNQHVAHVLHEAGMATLLVDLLTTEEELSREKVFDIQLLATRLEFATEWVKTQPETRAMPLGFFGASTGAGAALWAAAQLKDQVSAVVSRGGRPDMAVGHLEAVVAPTLLIVGGADTTVLQLNLHAQRQLECINDLVIVPDATHLFEEPGALDVVARAARDWFAKYFEVGER